MRCWCTSRPGFVVVLALCCSLMSAAFVAADGIFSGSVEVRTEHRGAGAPQHQPMAVEVPLSNWSTVSIVDISEVTAWACVRFTVTGLDLAYDCDDGAPVCWPIDESYDAGKVTVTVTNANSGKKLAKIVAKYKDGDTGTVCKSFPASLLTGASTVRFRPTARGLPAGELKLFQEASVFQEAAEGARLSEETSLSPEPGRARR